MPTFSKVVVEAKIKNNWEVVKTSYESSFRAINNLLLWDNPSLKVREGQRPETEDLPPLPVNTSEETKKILLGWSGFNWVETCLSEEQFRAGMVLVKEKESDLIPKTVEDLYGILEFIDVLASEWEEVRFFIIFDY